MCLMDVHAPQGEGAVSGIFWHFRRIHFNGRSDVRNVFD